MKPGFAYCCDNIEHDNACPGCGEEMKKGDKKPHYKGEAYGRRDWSGFCASCAGCEPVCYKEDFTKHLPNKYGIRCGECKSHTYDSYYQSVNKYLCQEHYDKLPSKKLKDGWVHRGDKWYHSCGYMVMGFTCPPKCPGCDAKEEWRNCSCGGGICKDCKVQLRGTHYTNSSPYHFCAKCAGKEEKHLLTK